MPGRDDLQGNLIDRPLVQRLQDWGHELGFSQIAVAGIDLHSAEAGLAAWLAAGFHGSMRYMARHGLKRARGPPSWCPAR